MKRMALKILVSLVSALGGSRSLKGFSGVVILRNSLLILVYYLFSIGLTFYQNHLLKQVKFPLSIVCCHLLIKFLISTFLRLGYRLWWKKYRVLLDCWTWFSTLSLIGISSGLDIGLSNWSQEFVTVSLYTMTKSTAVIFILIFALFFKLEERHWSLFFIVSLISGGLAMFTYKSSQFHLFGFCLVLAASALSGFRWSMAQLILQKSKLGLQNPIDMIYHIQPWMLVGVIPFAIYFEGPSLVKLGSGDLSLDELRFGDWHGSTEDTSYFILESVLIGSFMAFFMEVTEYLLVTFTSSLSLAVAGIFKEICTMVLAVIFNKDPLSVINFFGLLLCLFGILAHLLFKFLRTDGPSTGKEEMEDGGFLLEEHDFPLLNPGSDQEDHY